jgi:hypothetical protein
MGCLWIEEPDFPVVGVCQSESVNCEYVAATPRAEGLGDRDAEFVRGWGREFGGRARGGTVGEDFAAPCADGDDGGRVLAC